jgi:hypothetical protein
MFIEKFKYWLTLTSTLSWHFSTNWMAARGINVFERGTITKIDFDGSIGWSFEIGEW